MKNKTQLQSDIEKFKECIIVVEGKKDVQTLKSLGFKKVYAIHSTGVPLRERVEQIMSLTKKKDIICILTDLDKKGKQLYISLKPIFQELGARLDSAFRGILIKARISHIEGIYSFMEKLNQI